MTGETTNVKGDLPSQPKHEGAMQRTAEKTRKPSLPNILFVAYEDVTPRFGAYGDRVAQTPAFDRVAAEGAVFTQCYCTSPTCGPSRSAVFTGLYQNFINCQNMRTTHTNPHVPELPTPYVAVPPPYVKCFTEYLRAAGYFCTRQGKADFQFVRDIQGSPLTAFDRVVEPMPTNIRAGSRGEMPDPTWRQRPAGAPFFAYYNLDATHESGQWPQFDRLEPETDPHTVEVPPFLPDTLEVRKAIARQYDNLKKNDIELGHLLRMLEEDGLLDDTIVMVWSDHAEGLPRFKRGSHTCSYRVPLAIRYPRWIKPGTVVNDVVSNVDLAPTLFALAGLPIPPHFQGMAVIGPGAQKRDLAFSGRDRIGENYGQIRSIRDARYTHIRNYDLNQHPYAWEPYRNQHPVMREIWNAHLAGQLNAVQERIFFGLPPAEELYDRQTDPWELNNLAAAPEHQERLRAFRRALADWEMKYDPWRDVSEEVMKRLYWPDGTQPVTAAPRAAPLGPAFNGRVPVADGDRLPAPVLLQLHCATHGASVAYAVEKPAQPQWRLETEPINYDTPWEAAPPRETWWRLYTQPFELPVGEYTLRLRAIRYGYAESEERVVHFRVI